MVQILQNLFFKFGTTRNEITEAILLYLISDKENKLQTAVQY